ncbi:MAG: aminoacyl-tRNA hydrolase [Deltaproteobacteria bacterium]|nr:aminoacyl-tRNA hydrolase [Deltaproteobacteria bacterium]
MERETIRVAPGVEIPVSEVRLEMSRSSGPGGQHVNKTETRVTLRLPLAEVPLDEYVRARLLERLRPRLTKSGEILVSSGRHREREQNLREAFDRLERLLVAAWHRDPPRKKTRPSRGAKERRLLDKRKVTEKKRSRKSSEREE